MMVVTDAAVFLTRDAAQTWTKVSGLPKGSSIYAMRFSWDPIHNMVYAIVRDSVWRLEVRG